MGKKSPSIRRTLAIGLRSAHGEIRMATGPVLGQTVTLDDFVACIGQRQDDVDLPLVPARCPSGARAAFGRRSSGAPAALLQVGRDIVYRRGAEGEVGWSPGLVDTNEGLEFEGCIREQSNCGRRLTPTKSCPPSVATGHSGRRMSRSGYVVHAGCAAGGPVGRPRCAAGGPVGRPRCAAGCPVGCPRGG